MKFSETTTTAGLDYLGVRRDLGLLTEETVADVLGVEVSTLASWRSLGKGPRAVKLGKRVFYTNDAIASWIYESESTQNQPAGAPLSTSGGDGGCNTTGAIAA